VSRLVAKAPPIPGVKTVVSPKSEKNLPTDQDREKERALPPGAATPNSPSSGGGGGGKVVPKFEMNTPDADSQVSERPRSLPTPGEEYGHPTKYDYGYVTRRHFQGGDIDPEAIERILVAYKRRWRPGKYQRKSRGVTKLKRKRYYRKNRNRLKMRARRYYRVNRKKPGFQRVRKHRTKYPHMHRRRRASAVVVAAMLLEPSSGVVADRFLQAMRVQPPKSVPPVKRQTKQRGQDKTKDRAYYRRNRSKILRYNTKRNERIEGRGKENQYDQWYQEQYRARGQRPFRRRGSVLTSPQITFAFGPDFFEGQVHSVSPMTSMVTFVIQTPNVESLQSLSVPAFLHSAIFLTEKDIDAFFELVDIEVGEEAYEEFNVEHLRECAEMFHVDITSEHFANQCEDLVGDREVDAMTPDQLELVNDKLVSGVMEGGSLNERHFEVPEGEEAKAYDWHLYYGEVDIDLYAKEAGPIILFEQENPDDEVKSPGPDVGYSPSSPSHYRLDPDRKDGVPPGETSPDNHQNDNAPPASSRVVPPGEGQFVRSAATLDEIARRTAQRVHQRARKVGIRLRRADPQRGIWTFQATGSKRMHTIRVKGLRKSNVKELRKAAVQVSCSCEFFRWQGPEHWARANRYLYGRPRGTASFPRERDPRGEHWACKHVLAALNLARKYRFSSELSVDWLDLPIIPDYAEATSRVADRFLERSR
jgi:hypothetical protein